MTLTFFSFFTFFFTFRKLQAKEVDALKAEINMLRRKGGHVYTPAVTAPNRGQSGLHGTSAGSLGMDSQGEMMGDLPSR